MSTICLLLCPSKCLSEAEELYDKLTKKVESLGGSAAGNINQRAQDMKKEAEDLLRRATTGLDKLKSMCLRDSTSLGLCQRRQRSHFWHESTVCL